MYAKDDLLTSAVAIKIASICFCLMWASLCVAQETPRTVIDFNFGWRFALGDEQDWAQSEFDDQDWRKLHLPHDW